MAKRDIDIEDLLVWAYQDQCVDKAISDSPRLGSGFDSVMRLKFAEVDAGRFDGSDCHPDAEAVHFGVQGLSRVQQVLVIGGAKNSTRPDCMLGARLVMAAQVTAGGNPRRIYDDNRHCIGHAVAPAMEQADGSLFYAPADPRKPAPVWFAEVVGFHRAQYAAWWEALSSLALFLDAGRWLSDFHVTGPAAPSSPWDGSAVCTGEKAA